MRAICLKSYSCGSILLTKHKTQHFSAVSKESMDKKIYHGSTRIIRSPHFGAGRPYNDFGLGFYCTEYPQYAAEWAVGKDSNGFVSAYSLNCDGLRVINLCGPQYTALHWLYLLLSFRNFDLSSNTARRAREYINKYFSVDHQGCDCIAGYRADNRLFMFSQGFLDGDLSYRSLADALTADDSNRQFVLKSNRAFDRITFTDYRPASSADSYPVKYSREIRAIKKADRYAESGLFINDLIEQEVRPYDTRLR